MYDNTNQYNAGPQAPMNPSPIDVNFNMGEPVGRITYKTPCNCVIGVIVIVFFIVGFGLGSFMFYLYFSSNSVPIFVGFFLLIFGVVSIILGSCMSLFNYIDVDNSSGMVTIAKKKVFFCCNKTEVIQINEIVQVVVKTDPSTTYEINGVPYNAFEVIFILSNGREVKGCSGVIDKNGEGRRCFSTIRRGLPPKITYSGNLAY